MQTANVMVALGGDKGTTVPKYGVTISEIAVLQAIHGNDAVFDIEPTGVLHDEDGHEIHRSDREEIARLREVYGRTGTNGQPEGAVAHLFPGIAARAFRNWDEVDIPKDFFKPTERAAAPKAEPEEDRPTKAEKPAKRGKKHADEPEHEADDGDADGKLFG